jgi:hypothetical protein
MTSVAIHLGCDPIIFVGMDFSAENGKKYAHLEAPEVNEMQADWAMSVRMIQELASQHPDRKFLNATEGGTPFCTPINLQNIPCTQEWDLKKMVHEAIQSLPVCTPNLKRWEEWDQQGEIVHEKLLDPLWKIWGPPIAQMAAENGEMIDLHKEVFFQQILQAHHG